MIALMLAALLQSPVQEPTLEERIAAFLKGDGAARAEIVKRGAFAIRPLQKAREKSPEKIDALVLELKKVAAYPKNSEGPGQLDLKVEVNLRESPFRDVLTKVQEDTRLPLFYDKFDASDLKSKEVTVEAATVREVLDQICRQTGLDYGFFHNQIVLGKPDRLWPSSPPANTRPAFGPAATERQHKSPEEEKALKNLQTIKVGLDFQNASVAMIVSYMKEISGLDFEIEGDDASQKLTMRMTDQKLFDVVSLVTQSRDLDFMIKDGKVVIDTREGIEKKLTGRK